MTARNTKGVTVRTLVDGAVAVELTPTDISIASPATVTVTDTSSIAEENLVYIPAGATGMDSLDGKWFSVTNIVADTSFDLLGSDTTGEIYTPGASPELLVYPVNQTILLCWASLSFNPGTPDTISTGTFCDPTASVPSLIVEAGTVDFTGYVDVTDADYRMMDSLYQSGASQVFRIYLPDNGILVFEGVVASFNLDIPIDGAIGYSGQITLASKPRHLY